MWWSYATIYGLKNFAASSWSCVLLLFQRIAPFLIVKHSFIPCKFVCLSTRSCKILRYSFLDFWLNKKREGQFSASAYIKKQRSFVGKITLSACWKGTEICLFSFKIQDRLKWILFEIAPRAFQDKWEEAGVALCSFPLEQRGLVARKMCKGCPCHFKWKLKIFLQVYFA